MSKNIISFMSNASTSEWYYGMITQHLQPDFVAWNFTAETAEAFLEITEKSSGKWDILLTDGEVAQDNEAILAQFTGRNPGTIVGVVGTNPGLLVNAVLMGDPESTKDFLTAMHHLLGAS